MRPRTAPCEPPELFPAARPHTVRKEHRKPDEHLALAGSSHPSWRTLLDAGPLVLPAAHDSLAARLIARAGFRAYQVGGFALAGARYAFPDIDLIHFYEEQEAIRQIVAASRAAGAGGRGQRLRRREDRRPPGVAEG